MSALPPYAGRILGVDLSSGSVWHLPTEDYAHEYLGGRGIAARLAWDILPPGLGPFADESALMFFPGALVGTPAPSAGRTSVCGLSPQAYPYEWYTRSNLGGHWGAELKYAGYDGLVVRGRASAPVVLRIEDEAVWLEEATDLWGAGLVETQRRLNARLPEGTRVLAIGPAGENRCRFAVIATGTESAAGQGGYGAVMGAKNLKAIAVRGRGGLLVANPSEALRRSRAVMQAAVRVYGPGASPDKGRYGSRRAPCTYQCPRSCGAFYAEVRGAVGDRLYTGHMHCCSPLFVGNSWLGLGYSLEAGFQVAQVCNDLGLNHWELIFGLIPWILRCQERGELHELDGFTLDLYDPACLLELLRRIAYREGLGDLLAEGGQRAGRIIGIGTDILDSLYPAWGFASHWEGHGSFPSPYYPYWLVTALQWALDSRDPLGGGHGYTTNIFRLVARLEGEKDDAATRQRLLTLGRRLYGSAASVDPLSGYQGKAAPAVFHQDRNALKDCTGLCDNIFPMLTDLNAPDFLLTVDGEEGRNLEYYLFEAIAGGLDRESFYSVGRRVFTLERLIAMRNWGRGRGEDEAIGRYLQYPEREISPYTGRAGGFDPERFAALLEECYALRGWERSTGNPSVGALNVLGLADLPGLSGGPEGLWPENSVALRAEEVK